MVVGLNPSNIDSRQGISCKSDGGWGVMSKCVGLPKSRSRFVVRIGEFRPSSCNPCTAPSALSVNQEPHMCRHKSILPFPSYHKSTWKKCFSPGFPPISAEPNPDSPRSFLGQTAASVLVPGGPERRSVGIIVPSQDFLFLYMGSSLSGLYGSLSPATTSLRTHEKSSGRRWIGTSKSKRMVGPFW